MENFQRFPRYHVLAEPSAYFSREAGAEALKAYWDLFILDAFLGNFDRHSDNWSYFSLAGLSSMQVAPIYDCGSCLYPQIADEGIMDILANEAEINMRVDKFPTAALILDNGQKANYKEFITSGFNLDCTSALLRVFPRIDLSTVFRVIDTEPLSDIRKQFYKTILTARYDRILSPAYNSLKTSLTTHFFSR